MNNVENMWVADFNFEIFFRVRSEHDSQATILALILLKYSLHIFIPKDFVEFISDNMPKIHRKMGNFSFISMEF